MKTQNTNTPAAKLSFNELRAAAKELGINTKDMNAKAIEEAIAAKNVTVVVGESEAAIDETLKQLEEGTVEPKVERRGRPVVADSERQKRLSGYQAKVESGVELKRGRPANGESERQKRIAARNEKLANGIEVKRGRPALPKVEVTLPVGTSPEKIKEVEAKVAEVLAGEAN